MRCVLIGEYKGGMRVSAWTAATPRTCSTHVAHMSVVACQSVDFILAKPQLRGWKSCDQPPGQRSPELVRRVSRVQDVRRGARAQNARRSLVLRTGEEGSLSAGRPSLC